MLFPKLDEQSARISGYSDAVFANNNNSTSEYGRIILLIDDRSSSVPISFKSYNSWSVTRSVLSAEVIAFVDSFDDAFTLYVKI